MEEEIKHDSPKELEEEFGDLLFAVVNAARLYGVNPENALEKTNRKFIFRFNHLEKRAAEEGTSLKDMPLSRMEEIWNEAKNIERSSSEK